MKGCKDNIYLENGGVNGGGLTTTGMLETRVKETNWKNNLHIELKKSNH